MSYNNGTYSIHGQFYQPGVYAGAIDVNQKRSRWTWFLVTGLIAAIGALVIVNLKALQQLSTNSKPINSPSVIQQTPTPINQPAVVITQTPEEPKPTGPSSEDLQTLLNKWQQDYPASNVGVVIKELSGSKSSASLNADTRFEAASLYKLYLADYLYANVDKGIYSLSGSIGTSTNLQTCIKLMITISDNNCGESIGYGIGWLTLHRFVRASGFSSTTMINHNQTTAVDMASYLEKLENGQLLSAAFRDDLLSYMKGQIYRSAIPAGVPDISVADKVGFKDNVWNDAAIVYHPKGTYILVVLSSGLGSSAIKDLSSRASSLMSQ